MTKHVSIPFLVYHQSDLADVAHTFEPGAQEAGGYLRFIAEYYDCLPQVGVPRGEMDRNAVGTVP